MIKCICFLAYDMDEELERQIMQLDTPQNEVHLVTNVLEDDFCPPIIISFLEENGFGMNEELYFYSDLEGLCKIVEKVYSRLFTKVTYLEGKEKRIFPLDEIYEIILSYPMENITRDYCVYFQIEKSYFVWEPIVGNPVIITSKGKRYQRPEGQDICYMYPHFEEELGLIQAMPLDEEAFRRTGNIYVIQFLRKLQEKMHKFPFQINMFSLALENACLKGSPEMLQYCLLCFFFLIHTVKQGRYVDYFNQMVYENKEKFSYYQKYYLWRQQKHCFFILKGLHTRENYAKLIYDDIYEGYRNECNIYLQPILKEKRNINKILILTSQFLNDTHAPTKSTLERCMTLQRDMHMEILVVNTREVMTTLGKIPLYGAEHGSVVEQYSEFNEYRYHDTAFRFKQCKDEMPNFKETKELLELIREEKPYLILTIGSGSIVSDLAANIVPVINLPVVFSTIIKKNNQFTAVGRKISEKEWKELINSGYKKESIIESVFTFRLKPQEKYLTREMLGLPQNKFLLLTVGVRLHHEIDDEFINTMKDLYSQEIHLVFAGFFENYEKLCQRHEGFAEHSTYIGYQEDIMAINEIIDLYINPRRLGGGYSIIEAFSKGKPGITLNQGDVAAAAGTEFCVETYDDMKKMIIRYIKEPDFYDDRSQKAYKRAEELADSKASLEHIMTEAEKRNLFF